MIPTMSWRTVVASWMVSERGKRHHLMELVARYGCLGTGEMSWPSWANEVHWVHVSTRETTVNDGPSLRPCHPE